MCIRDRGISCNEADVRRAVKKNNIEISNIQPRHIARNGFLEEFLEHQFTFAAALGDVVFEIGEECIGRNNCRATRAERVFGGLRGIYRLPIALDEGAAKCGECAIDDCFGSKTIRRRLIIGQGGFVAHELSEIGLDIDVDSQYLQTLQLELNLSLIHI